MSETSPIPLPRRTIMAVLDRRPLWPWEQVLVDEYRKQHPPIVMTVCSRLDEIVITTTDPYTGNPVVGIVRDPH